eukprot:ANDGO_05061.mRNA.1 hypothetical protein
MSRAAKRQSDVPVILSPIRDSLSSIENKLRDLRMTANVVSPPRHRKAAAVASRNREALNGLSDTSFATASDNTSVSAGTGAGAGIGAGGHGRKTPRATGLSDKSRSSKEDRHASSVSSSYASRKVRDAVAEEEEGGDGGGSVRAGNKSASSAFSVDDLVSSIDRELKRTRKDVRNLQNSLDLLDDDEDAEESGAGAGADDGEENEESADELFFQSAGKAGSLHLRNGGGKKGGSTVSPRTRASQQDVDEELERLSLMEDEVQRLKASLRSSTIRSSRSSIGGPAQGSEVEVSRAGYADFEHELAEQDQSSRPDASNNKPVTDVSSVILNLSRKSHTSDAERQDVERYRSQLIDQEVLFRDFQRDKEYEISQLHQLLAKHKTVMEEEKRRHLKGLEDMRDLLTDREAEIARLQSIMDRVNTDLEKAQRERAEQIASLSHTWELRLQDVTGRMSAFQAEADELRRARTDLTDKLHSERRISETVQAENEKLVSNCRDFETRLDNMSAQLESTELKLKKSFRQRELELLGEVDALKRQAHDATVLSQSAKREIDRTEREAELKMKMLEEAHRRQLELLKSRIDQGDMSSNENERRVRTMKDRLAELESILENTRSTEDGLRQLVKQQGTSLADANIRNENLQRELVDAQSREKDARSRLKHVQERTEGSLQDMKGRMDDLNMIIEQHRDALVQANKDREDAVRAVSDKYQSELHAAAVRHEQLIRENAEIRKAAQENEVRCAELTSQMERQLSLIEGKESEWGRQVNALKQSVEQERQEWNRRVAQLEEENASRMKEKDGFFEEGTKLRREMKNMRRDSEKERQRLEDVSRKLQEEKKEAEDQRARLEAELQKARKKLDADLRARLELGTEKQAAQLETDRLKKTLEREQKRREEAEKKLGKLEKRLQSSFRETEDLGNEQMAVLEVLRDSLHSEREKRNEAEARIAELEQRAAELTTELSRRSMDAHLRDRLDRTTLSDSADSPVGRAPSAKHAIGTGSPPRTSIFSRQEPTYSRTRDTQESRRVVASWEYDRNQSPNASESHSPSPPLIAADDRKEEPQSTSRFNRMSASESGSDSNGAESRLFEKSAVDATNSSASYYVSQQEDANRSMLQNVSLTDLYRAVGTEERAHRRSTSPPLLSSSSAGRSRSPNQQKSKSPIPFDHKSNVTDLSVLKRYYDAELAGFRERVRSMSTSRSIASSSKGASPIRVSKQLSSSPPLRSPNSKILSTSPTSRKSPGPNERPSPPRRPVSSPQPLTIPELRSAHRVSGTTQSPPKKRITFDTPEVKSS